MVIALDRVCNDSTGSRSSTKWDSVLIDEARTPLIISGPVGNENDGMFAEHNAAVERLVRRQTEVANSLVAEGERLLDQKDAEGARLALFKAQLGVPRTNGCSRPCRSRG